MIRQSFRQANKSALTGETIPLRALQAMVFTVQGKGGCPRLGKPSPRHPHLVRAEPRHPGPSRYA